jgi:hypothetical protein
MLNFSKNTFFKKKLWKKLQIFCEYFIFQYVIFKFNWFLDIYMLKPPLYYGIYNT